MLFVLGYEPMQVVPTLLVSQAFTGLASGIVHNDMANVSFSLRPPTTETRLLGLLVVLGSLAMAASVLTTYLVLDLPSRVIKTYVAGLVLVMGVLGFLRARLRTQIAYRPRRLAGFVLLAGVYKGIGAGGFGLFVTLGQVLSGVYEKSAVAITTMAEGLISIVGVGAFALASRYGVSPDLRLLVPIVAGAFLAALVGPYLARVVPNAIWRHVIPIYAIVIGAAALLLGLGV